MNNNKHLPYYIFLVGVALLSIGLNIIQNQESHVLRLEKKCYKTLYDSIYLKYLKLQLDILDGKFDKKNIT